MLSFWKIHPILGTFQYHSLNGKLFCPFKETIGSRLKRRVDEEGSCSHTTQEQMA